MDPFAEAHRERREELEHLHGLLDNGDSMADAIIAGLEELYRRDPEEAAEFEAAMVADLIRVVNL